MFNGDISHDPCHDLYQTPGYRYPYEVSVSGFLSLAPRSMASQWWKSTRAKQFSDFWIVTGRSAGEAAGDLDTSIQFSRKNKLSRLKRIPYVFSIWPIDSGPFGHLILCGHDNGSCGLNIVEISTCIIIISNIIIIIIIINYYYYIIYMIIYVVFSQPKTAKSTVKT